MTWFEQRQLWKPHMDAYEHVTMAFAQWCTCFLSKSLIHFGNTSSEVRCGCTSNCNSPQLQLVSGLQTLVVALRNVFQLVHVLVMVQGDDLHSRTDCCFCKWCPVKSTPLSARCKAHASNCFACLMCSLHVLDEAARYRSDHNPLLLHIAYKAPCDTHTLTPHLQLSCSNISFHSFSKSLMLMSCVTGLKHA